MIFKKLIEKIKKFYIKFKMNNPWQQALCSLKQEIYEYEYLEMKNNKILEEYRKYFVENATINCVRDTEIALKLFNIELKNLLEEKYNESK